MHVATPLLTSVQETETDWNLSSLRKRCSTEGVPAWNIYTLLCHLASDNLRADSSFGLIKGAVRIWDREWRSSVWPVGLPLTCLRTLILLNPD
jgi:hypothetical protein